MNSRPARSRPRASAEPADRSRRPRRPVFPLAASLALLIPAVVGPCGATWAVAADGGGGGVPVDGDLGLLRSLRDGLRESERRAARGEMKFEVEISRSVPGESGRRPPERLAGTVRWDERGARWDVTAPPDEVAARRGGGADGRAGRVVLYDGRRVVRYVPRKRTVSVYPVPTVSHLDSVLPAVYLVRPADCWFDLAFGFEIPWHEALDPDAPLGSVRRFEASGPTDAVRVVRHYEGGRQEVAARLGRTGVVDRAETEGDRSGGGTTYRAVWASTGDGTFYPKTLHTEHALPVDDGVQRTTFDLRVSSFEVREGMPTSALTLAALDLPRGTRVVRYGVDGRPIRETYIGGNPATDDQLEILSEQLKTGPFAAPAGGR